MSKELKGPVEDKQGALDFSTTSDSVETTESTEESSKGPVKMRKTKRTKACFNCGKPVDPLDHECPHCKATGKNSKVNSGAYLRIALGFFLGLVLWAIFYW